MLFEYFEVHLDIMLRCLDAVVATAAIALKTFL